MSPSDDDQNRPDARGARPARALDRRGFLAVAGSSAGLALVASAVPGCGDKDPAPFGELPAGNVAALSVGTLLVMGNVIVARDEQGVYAMTAICTHQGCTVRNVSHLIEGGAHCPCHGSIYDGNGAVTQGPAARPLQHYAVTLASDGSLTVDGHQPVPADTRTPVV
ncbi:MAG TPA: Rieske 2Fe-2S domain-containing protein [Polyangia bacterium]|nr:Rieske 2Fe-2S domain-containing protein [Polyangia bacterium]